jgi:hypothetical protein
MPSPRLPRARLRLGRELDWRREEETDVRAPRVSERERRHAWLAGPETLAGPRRSSGLNGGDSGALGRGAQAGCRRSWPGRLAGFLLSFFSITIPFPIQTNKT